MEKYCAGPVLSPCTSRLCSREERGLYPYLGHSIIRPEVSVWGAPRACTAISHSSALCLRQDRPSVPKCWELHCPLGSGFHGTQVSLGSLSPACVAAACLDRGPLGPGAEAWSVRVLCLSPYLHGTLTLRPWKSGWFVISPHRERVQTPHQTSSCFLAAGLKRPWPCCLPLPRFPQAVDLWALVGAGIHSNSLLLVMPWTAGILSLSAEGSPSWSLGPSLCLSPFRLLKADDADEAIGSACTWEGLIGLRLGHTGLPGTCLRWSKPEGGCVSDDASLSLCSHTVNAGEGWWQ